jgi:1,4-dihydroxy-6-naphthoate synthase
MSSKSQIANSKSKIHLGHSPDPDDAFMFYALAHGKVDTGGLVYEHHLEDIQTLNERAKRGEYEVTAISIHAYAYIADKYQMLPCGASVGEQYGPMVIAREEHDLSWLEGKRVAIPGTMTTAYLVLRLAAYNFQQEVIPFDTIPDAVAAGYYNAGLIIHEGQLTYQKLGLHLVADLGQWWHDETGLPLPLGGNAVRRDLGLETIKAIHRHVMESIKWGLAHREEALGHALKYARDMKIEDADKFVGMYVNQRTLDYGEDGRRAAQELLDRGHKAGVIAERVRIDW